MKAELTLKTAKEMYKQGGAAKMFALDNYTEDELTKKDLPKTWEELEYIKGSYIDIDSVVIKQKEATIATINTNRNVFPTKELAEASLALAQLLQLRERYNDGWVADWNNSDEDKYGIYSEGNKIKLGRSQYISVCLNFKTEELRDLFLENFRDLIETAKPLL